MLDFQDEKIVISDKQMASELFVASTRKESAGVVHLRWRPGSRRTRDGAPSYLPANA